ncbi:MAG TPA: protein kinase [Planctomycetota bacterium]|nr:protein kinase [Planctomycetota bacterium]
MPPNDRPESDAAACDFLDLVDRDRAAGRLRSLAEYLLRFPGFEERITRELAAIVRAAPAAADRQRTPAVSGRIGRYRLLAELGRGGQAVVWLAHDEVLDRRIALKVLADGAGWLSQTRRERLQREASALARLDHPGICTIHEAELGGEIPFLAMRYVDGETLATRLRRAREQPDAGSERLLAAVPDRPLRIARVLELGEKIARALHTAHESGVVHRDIKPQNVMLTADDQPVILDFGVARTEDGDALTLTRAGELFGSMAYLPPERFSGDGVADRRGDVYALGVTLYECLTLTRPFVAETTAALIAEVTAGNRRDPTAVNRAIARDVALVLDTALESDPARRYASALDLAEDLRRLRHHEPITARPIGGWLHLVRFTRRHPVMTVAAGLLVLALLVSTTLLVQLAAQRQRLLAWQQVLEALSSGDQPTEALGRVLAAAPHVPESKLNGPLLDLLTHSSALLEFDQDRLGALPTGSPCFTADDRQLLIPTAGGEIAVVDAADGCCRRRIDAHGGKLMSMRVAGHIAVTSGLDARVRCFDTATWSEQPLPAEIARSNADVDRAADPNNRLPRRPVLARDGSRLLLLGFDQALLVTPVAAAGAPWRLDRPGFYAHQACFSPDGQRLVVRWQNLDPGITREQGASDVRVLAVSDGRELAELDLGGQETMCCAWDDAGGRLAVAGHDGCIRVLDTSTWQCTAKMQAGGEDRKHVYWVGFTPAGDQLVTLGFEGLTVWDSGTGLRLAHVVSASARPFHTAAWSDDGSRLATVVKDGTVRVFDRATWTQTSTAHWRHRYPDEVIWNHAGDRIAYQDGVGLQVVTLQAPAPEFQPHREAITSIAFFADGRHVLTGSADTTAAVVDLGTGRADLVLPHPAAVRRARLSADEHRIVTACADGAVRIWARTGGTTPLQLLRAHQGSATDAQFFADDQRVLTIGADGGARVFDAATGRMVCELTPHTRACLCAAVDPLLALIATGGADHRVLVHDLQGKLLAALDTLGPAAQPGLELEGNASALAFDRARRRLVVANRNLGDTMVIYDLDGWRPTWIKTPDQGQEYSLHLAFAQGGRFYATAHSGVSDWTFVDAGTLQPRDFGKGSFPAAIVSAMRFSPDARLLLVAARDDSVSVWDLARGERHLELRGRHGGIRAAEFSQDGQWVATGSQDGTLRAWPVQPLPFAREHHARLTGKRAGS